MIKGQGTLEMLIGLGGIIIVALIVITMVIGGLLQDTGDTANDNLFAFIDAIETNESNMLENSSFEIDTTPADGVPDFWIIPHPSNFYLSNEESRRGSYSIKLISTPGNLLGNPYGKEMHQEVTLAKGTYRIYAYIMQKAGERFANNDPYFDVYCEDCGAGDHELCDAFLPAEKDNVYDQWVRPSSTDCEITQTVIDNYYNADPPGTHSSITVMIRIVAEDDFAITPPVGWTESIAYIDSVGLLKIN